jgi:predicted transcriptional regulator
MGRRKTSILKNLVQIDVDMIISPAYLNILTLIAAEKAKYTTKIAKILGKEPSTVNEEIKKLLNLGLLKVGRRTKAQEYEINWDRLTKMTIEHWKRTALVHSRKLKNRKVKRIFLREVENICNNPSMKELIKYYFCKYSQLKQNGELVLVPSYGVFFSEDNILTLTQQMLVDFISSATLEKMKKYFTKENKTVYRFFRFFKKEILDVTSIYEKSAIYAVDNLRKR